jgi:hypothetical protein
MQDDQSDMRKEAHALATTTPLDHARSIIVAGTQAIPIIGGPLASFLNDYLPNWKTQRIQLFLENLTEDFERTKKQVNAQAAKTEEFCLLYEIVLRKVGQISNKEKEKLTAYRAILLNTTRPGAPDDMKRDHFLGLLDRLQEAHILLISLFYDPAAFCKAHQVTALEKLPATTDRILEECLRPFDIGSEFLENLLFDLENMGITTRRMTVGVNIKPNIVASAAAEHELKSKLTPHGRAFAHFIALHE